MSESNPLSPIEASAVARRAALPERWDKIGALLKSLERHGGLISSHMVNAVNVEREIGIELQALAGHEQISMAFWRSLEFPQGETGARVKLPLDFERAKGFVAIARELKEPAKTFAQAYAVHKRAFVQMELIEIEVGQGNGAAAASDAFTVFVHDLTVFKQRVTKLEVGKLSQERRQTLKADLQWAVELYEQLEG